MCIVCLFYRVLAIKSLHYTLCGAIYLDISDCPIFTIFIYSRRLTLFGNFLLQLVLLLRPGLRLICVICMIIYRDRHN